MRGGARRGRAPREKSPYVNSLIKKRKNRKVNCYEKKKLFYVLQNLLYAMLAPGRSKHTDKCANGGQPLKEYIYSFATFKRYLAVAFQFARWVIALAGDAYISVEAARAYVAPYLEHRISRGLSAQTIKVDACALAKIYQCRSTDFGVELPTKHRSDSTKNMRLPDDWDPSRYPALVTLCMGTGLRRHEIVALRPQDVVRCSDGTVRVRVRRGKGGKKRYVDVLPDYADAVEALAQEARAQGRDKVLGAIPSHAPIHAYRHIYAQKQYQMHARDITSLDRSDLYVCRQDMKHIVLDREAMAYVSRQLGHNRLGVVTTYLRGASFLTA